MSKFKNNNDYVRALGITFSIALLAGCHSDTQNNADLASAEPVETVVKTADRALPPGFTDAPPAPPTSDTYVLSGGTLQLEDVRIADSVVVIRNGDLLAWGRRGDTEVPHDSIGIDVRNKWLVASTVPLQADQLANLRILNSDPQSTTSEDVHGIIRDGVLQLTEAP